MDHHPWGSVIPSKLPWHSRNPGTKYLAKKCREVPLLYSFGLCAKLHVTTVKTVKPGEIICIRTAAEWTGDFPLDCNDLKTLIIDHWMSVRVLKDVYFPTYFCVILGCSNKRCLPIS